MDFESFSNDLPFKKQGLYLPSAALSVPCAFSKSELPIGLQIVGRHNADLAVLQMGYAFEQATNVGRRRPKL